MSDTERYTQHRSEFLAEFYDSAPPEWLAVAAMLPGNDVEWAGLISACVANDRGNASVRLIWEAEAALRRITPLVDDEQALAAGMLLAGADQAQVATKLGRPEEMVTKWHQQHITTMTATELVRVGRHAVAEARRAGIRRDAVAEYASGTTADVVGHKYGVTAKTVRVWAQQNAAELQHGPGRALPEHTRESAVAAYLSGTSSHEVARRHGVARITVAKWVRAAGHEMRRPGPRGDD